jgi:hypothetical protein
MTRDRLAMLAALVALAAVLVAAFYDGVCDHLAAADAEQRLTIERQRWAAEWDRQVAELRALGDDAVFRALADAIVRLERGATGVNVAAELARACEAFPRDARGPALYARYTALRARRHAAHQGAAATVAYLQALGLP